MEKAISDDRTALVLHTDTGRHEKIPCSQISDALDDPKALLWFDITSPTPDDAELLREEFGFHELALEELGGTSAPAKCLEFAGLYVLVLSAADYQPTAEEPMRLRQVVIYIGSRFLVTAHEEAFPEIGEVVRRWQANTAVQRDSIAAPLYSLMDTIVDGYFPVLDQITEQVEDLEDSIFTGSAPLHATDVFRLKRDLLQLRKVVAGQRDALNLLLRQDVPLFPEASLLFFQSVYDHLVRLVESIDTYRDLLSSAMDLHLSVLSNRMNQVMKTLTAISTMLMSAALIAGIYGMNFEHMPELHWRYGYPLSLALMVTVAGGLGLYFKKIGWF